MSTAWYDELRDNHRPDVVEVLLVAESPPDPGSTDRRFFYSPTLDGKDNLYRGVATALYGRETDFDLTAKATVLRRIQRDGFWLIDLCDEPVNHLPPSARRRALQDAVPDLVARAVAVAPTRGVIVCMTPVHRLVAAPLEAAGVPVLHDTPLPFPMSWLRADFVEGFRHTLGSEAF